MIIIKENAQPQRVWFWVLLLSHNASFAQSQSSISSSSAATSTSPTIPLILQGGRGGPSISFDWEISYVENINPDGRFPRRVVGVNGAWP
jgi:hypothetical protein